MTEELKPIKCKVSKCENYIKFKSTYCSKHQARLARTGRLSLKTHKEKLLEKISIDKESKCWNWIKYKNEHGYGRLRINGKKILAHRASYKIFKGKIPSGLLICHKCDNPACINPDHLFIGTDKDNVRDAMNKNRFWSTKLG